MAVASLSIQLIESISRIKAFIRHVKNAPNELLRLTELLERLSAVLEDVRDVLVQQSSLEEQDFPMPSTTILNCLKGCEDSLQPLQRVIERYEHSQLQTASAIGKIKGGIKLGLKVKDIASLESRIQQDIHYLTNALLANQTKIM